jgi:hypothetical protein
MSTFKCGLRRFDGHGTSNYRPANTAATKEMESAYSKMMRLRDQQDRGEYTVQTTEYRPERDEPKKVVPDQPISKVMSDEPTSKGLPSLPKGREGVSPGVIVAAQPQQNSRFLTYSLSDANPNKNTE